MSNYFRASIKSVKSEPNDAGGETVTLESLFDKAKVDYSNLDNLHSLAYVARKNANGLYDLVMERYRSSHPADIPNFEMLVALINLSSEIYMKCIIYFKGLNNGKACKEGHGLKTYFNKLPEDVKSELKSIDVDFDLKLDIISDYFTKFRYSFEFNSISADLFAFCFAEKLNQVCNSFIIEKPQEVIASQGKVLIQ